jgi:hypothetical protein
VAVDPWTTAGISLLSATVGALLGGGVTQLREWYKERQHRGRVATALSSEVMGVLDVVATCASLANLAEHGLRPDRGMKPILITSTLPPEPVAYRSLLSQLPLLSPIAVAATIAFHGSVEWAKSVSSQPLDGPAFPPDHVLRLGHAWRAAALNGLRALRALLKHSTAPRTDVDDEHIALLKADVQAVLRNEWPRLKFDEATGQMQIGPSWSEERRRAAGID